MNKGRNILLLMIVLLGVSILTFFTIFERDNKNGVVDGVRYIVESEQDGIKTIKFYFHEKDRVEEAEAVDNGDRITFTIKGYGYRYEVDKKTYEVTETETGGEITESPYKTYTKALFKQIVRGKGKFVQIWQSIIVGVILIAGGLIILFAEEIWHIIKKKGPDEIPKWKDMSGIKWAGGGVIALGAGLFLLFILI